MRGMWKKIFVSAMILTWMAAITVFAEPSEAGQRVYDLADLFDEAEESALSEAILDLQDVMDMGVAIVTTEENNGSARTFADDWYETYEIGVGANHDGALFLIDMENGELWISTEGKMIRYLTDERIDQILDDAVEYAYDGSFYEASMVFLRDLETYYEAGIRSDQYNYDTETGAVNRYHSIQWYEFAIALAVSGVVAGGAVLAVVRDYNMKDSENQLSANFRLSYRKDSEFKLHNALVDAFLGSYVTRTVIRTNHNRPSGGGSHRSSAGAGRSSTHRSSSGRVHGGGGRKFR